MPMLEEGQAAPDFELAASSGGTLSLKHYRGNAVVLYFYPGDDTPTCTVEACEFGAQHPKFAELGCPVLGISPDSLTSHEKFSAKYKLPFPLLVDEGHKLASQYGLWVKKQMFGNTYMGVQRTTFLIDARGKIAKIWMVKRAKGHAAEVLAALENL